MALAIEAIEGFRSLWLPCLSCNRELDSPHRVFEFCIQVEVGMDIVVSLSSSSGSVHRAVSLFFVIVVHVVGNLHIFKGPTRRFRCAEVLSFRCGSCCSRS